NKFLLAFDHVRRFDVVVFKYPLDLSRNFIKRVVGLPDETVKARDGDIYYRKHGEATFLLAKKPLDVQESIWIPAYEANFDRQGNLVADHWLPDTKDYQMQGKTLVVPAPAGKRESRFVYAGTIVDTAPRGGFAGDNQVGDVRLSFTVTPAAGDGAVLLRLSNGRHVVTAQLAVGAAGGSQVEYSDARMAGANNRVFPVARTLAPGRPAQVALMWYDGSFCLKVDDAVLVHEDAVVGWDLFSGGEGGVKQISFGVRDVGASFAGLAIHRDIFYTSRGCLSPEDGIDLPAGKYFMIGDNAQNSKDSRLWRLLTVKRKDGTVLKGDADDRHTEGNRLVMTDLYGVQHKIPESELAGPPVTEDQKYVDESELVGKAFFVWWPPNRMKLIR
ncbi:MAG: hypothetical protein HZA54_15335, partial [Planctomycetes bacterium]|nr:hypothetical protein [Planctomycetota bacterium]